MRKMMVCGLLAALASPALAQPAPKPGGDTAGFVKMAAISDMFETQTSELAAIRADAPTRAFAAKMNEGHQKAASELEMITKPHFAATPIPSSMDASHQAKLDKLKLLQGTAFTRQYQADQVAAHKDAVAAFERYASTGSDPGLKAWAGRMTPVLQAHLAQAEALTK